MPKDISIKELRQNLAQVADRVEKGESFRVIRRSKPSFIIMKVDAEMPEEQWETVVDFTDGGKTKGVPLKEVIKEMQKLQRS
ncbi:MAG: type II toxin-antitoxin system Phd/YefM family antitoxin [Patescibacteria group bacterium]